ncbi:septation protein SepH [Janibacter indicus]|uniref:septation protein SepH n=1 Tax=Janibacter indicus TaxID=857417 RepID=UPI003EB6F437
MRDLRLIGVHDDGEHLVVTDDAGEEYRLRIDEPLRAAARRDRPRLGQLQIAIDNNVRPREVQAMIRAGASADEVAARTGWDLDKIARFEGPILAEREHVATRAQTVRMRGTNQAGSPETLAQRAATRLTGRGVEPSSVEWDAFRDAEGQWTVSAVFAAGGRDRTATWWFDLAGMSVVAKNDEAKWLSEADTPQAGPVPTPVHRPTAVFDVEVEETKAERATRANTDDLINSMREHSGAKSRRRGGGRRKRASEAAAAPAHDDALPLEELPPPARGTHPRDEQPAEPTQAQAEAQPAPGIDGPTPASATPDESKDDTPVEPEDVTPDEASGPAGDAADSESTDTDSDTESDDLAASEGTAPQAEAETEAAPQPQESSAKGRGRKGRKGVPSWDDVMFGTTRD